MPESAAMRGENTKGQAGVAMEPDPACCLAGTSARRLLHGAAVDRERGGAVRHVSQSVDPEAASDARDRRARDCGRKRSVVARVEHGYLHRFDCYGSNVTPRRAMPQSAALHFGGSDRPTVAALLVASRQTALRGRCPASVKARPTGSPPCPTPCHSPSRHIHQPTRARMRCCRGCRLDWGRLP